ncbi:hypothetical protein K2D_05940 [Planctomycetes bacterium K2D]|nr:hypothetical protein K2D_05940 [Planctomycetes bacterium K2D]
MRRADAESILGNLNVDLLNNEVADVLMNDLNVRTIGCFNGNQVVVPQPTGAEDQRIETTNYDYGDTR